MKTIIAAALLLACATGGTAVYAGWDDLPVTDATNIVDRRGETTFQLTAGPKPAAAKPVKIKQGKKGRP